MGGHWEGPEVSGEPKKDLWFVRCGPGRPPGGFWETLIFFFFFGGGDGGGGGV